MDQSRVSALCNQLQLSPYQSYILENNAKKYDLEKLIKRGGILYAPHAHTYELKEYVARVLVGPRADVIGSDKMLVADQRGVKVHTGGTFSAYKNGIRYHADAFGNRIK